MALGEHSADGRARTKFTCLVRRDDINERLALVLKQQFNAVGVEMEIEEAGMDDIMRAISRGAFDAVLIDMISGPTLLRTYKLWHSGNSLHINNPKLDATLDLLRSAASEDEAAHAVAAIQQAAIEDPPVIFLAWMDRARAVSKRFTVTPAESGRDILSTLRLWTPANEARTMNRN